MTQEPTKHVQIPTAAVISKIMAVLIAAAHNNLSVGNLTKYILKIEYRAC